jgi:L-iditol 2-dehydrogenase
MSRMIKAFKLHGPADLRLEEVERPKPAEDEALVQIKSVGVCGSDVHYYRRGRIGPFIVEKPMILGHECSGEIVEVGRQVAHLKLGDRVVIEPGIPCRTCWYCRNGRYNKCPSIKFMATPPYDGALVEYVAWAADYLFKMPDSMSYQQGALVEPFAVGLFAAQRSGITPGASVTILGSGPIGLATLEAVKALGAGQIIMVDVIASRLALARQMGATQVVNPKEENLLNRVKELTNGEGSHFVFETAGTAPTVRQTVDVVRDGGSVILVGLPSEAEIPMPIVDAVIREISFITLFRYSNIFEEAISLISHDRVNIKPLITHEFPFSRAVEAINFAESAKDKAIKVIINL